MRTSLVPPYAAFLRVYEPLEAFPDGERQHWLRYLGAPDRPGPADLVAAEHAAALRRATALPPLAAPERDSGQAYVLHLDGVPLVCPAQERLRSWLALEAFRSASPPALVGAVLPPEAVRAAAEALARWRADHPGRQPRILTATWRVPTGWFAAFAGRERELHTDPVPVLRYRATMADARRRMARALAVLRRNLEDGTVTHEVESVARWLEEFHPRGVVELDYGGLVGLLDPMALDADTSAADVAEGLASLAAGAPQDAAAAYARLLERWRVVQALAQAG